MGIYDGCLDEGIRVVDVRHEQAAVHAADAWARLNPGRVGVAILTAGPGVTVARATTPGVFITPPTRAEEMYNPRNLRPRRNRNSNGRRLNSRSA